MTTSIAKPTNFGRQLLIARCLRVMVITVIVGALCAVSYNFGRLWHAWRHAGQSHVESHPATDLEAMMSTLPLAGQWQFADANWNLRSQTIKPADVVTRLEEVAVAGGDDTASNLPDLNTELVDLASKLHITPIKHGDNELYRLDRPDLKAQLVVRHVAGRPKVAALAAAFPKAADEWQLYEFTPRITNSSSTSGISHLLPLPMAAKRSGGRFTDDGNLLMELVSLDSNADSLLQLWKHNGWEVKKTGFSGPDDFSYLCGRGGQVIYAWSAGPQGSIRNLMLVRSPHSADIQAQANANN